MEVSPIGTATLGKVRFCWLGLGVPILRLTIVGSVLQGFVLDSFKEKIEGNGPS